jgi:hypothetical protein
MAIRIGARRKNFVKKQHCVDMEICKASFKMKKMTLIGAGQYFF